MSNASVKIKMCYVQNQWYDISCATLYVKALFVSYTLQFYQGFKPIIVCNCLGYTLILYSSAISVKKANAMYQATSP